MRTLRILPDLYAGPYVDRPGAVLLIGDRIVHLTFDQCRRLGQMLTKAVDSPHSRGE